MLVRNITTKVNTATLCLPERSRRPVFASTPLSRTSKNIACGNVADHHNYQFRIIFKPYSKFVLLILVEIFILESHNILF